MKKYEKPVVMVNEELAEGVYANSGDCWSASYQTGNEWTGKGHEFRIQLVHSTNLKHISTYVTIKVVFSNNIVSEPISSNNCIIESIGSNYVIVRREGHGNSYKSGDTTDFTVTVSTGDEATTRALFVESVAPTFCNRVTNVQGENDN